MNIHTYCLTRYRIKQLLLPVYCLLLCMPLLVLAGWQGHVLWQHQQRWLGQMQRLKKPVLKRKASPKQSLGFLVNQLQMMKGVFHSGLRLLQLSWVKNTLQVKAEAVSPAVFFPLWAQWKKKSPGVRLKQYRWQGSLMVQMQVHDAVVR